MVVVFICRRRRCVVTYSQCLDEKRENRKRGSVGQSSFSVGKAVNRLNFLAFSLFQSLSLVAAAQLNLMAINLSYSLSLALFPITLCDLPACLPESLVFICLSRLAACFRFLLLSFFSTILLRWWCQNERERGVSVEVFFHRKFASVTSQPVFCCYCCVSWLSLVNRTEQQQHQLKPLIRHQGNELLLLLLLMLLQFPSFSLDCICPRFQSRS